MSADLRQSYQLLAVRHSKVGSPPGLCYGRSDVALADSYEEEKTALREQLLHFTLAGISSSPLRRCRQLAEDLALGPVQIEAYLQELNFGRWEGLLWSEIPRDESELWTADIIERPTPGGESFAQLIQRVERLLSRLKPPPESQSLLWVTHAGVLRALWHLLGGLTPRDCLEQPAAHAQIQGWNPWPR